MACTLRRVRLRIPLLLAVLACVVAVAPAAARQGHGPRRPASFGLVKFADGLRSPVYLTSAPGDKRLFVVEQEGTIRTISNGKVASKPYADLRRYVTAGGEQGLLSMAFSPDFASNGKLYVYFTNKQGNEVIWELHARKGAASIRPGHRELVQIPDTEGNHNGGQLQFGPDGMLYFGDGDGGGGGDQHGEHGNGQNPGILLGKLSRIDVTTRTGRLPVRHPQGQPVRGQGGLASRDLGARPAQSVALLVRPRERRSVDRRRRPERLGGSRPPQARPRRHQLRLEPLRGPARLRRRHARWPAGKLRRPVAEYSHSEGCSITGGYVYRGPRIAGLSGRYVYADYCSGKMWTLSPAGGAPRDVSSVVSDAGAKSIVSFGQDGSGMLYVCTAGGTIYRFVSR